MLERLHLLSPLFSILSMGPDPEAIKATCAKFPAMSMNFGSGPYAKAEVDFSHGNFFSDIQKSPDERCI